jgi:predicted nucleotidyltransferase component of viral defense system
MKWLELSNEDRLVVLQQASAISGINNKALEKDIWVTIVLDAIFRTKYAKHLHFKGGTSLSKAWKIIERFSEDIDLSIDRSFYGFSEELSYSQIKKLKRISSEFISTEFKDELEKTIIEIGVPANMFTIKATPIPEKMKDTVDPQEIVIEYVSVLEPIEYLPDTIKVEVSARSIKEATKIRAINSIVDGLLPEIGLLGESFQVCTIEPQVTMLEKIFLLHEEFTKSISDMRHLRMSRHLYDLYKLHESSYADIAIKDKSLYERIIAHRQQFIRQSGIDYDHHGGETISFIPPSHILDSYKDDYEKMNLNMIYGDAPSFEVLIEKLNSIQELIRKQ